MYAAPSVLSASAIRVPGSGSLTAPQMADVGASPWPTGHRFADRPARSTPSSTKCSAKATAVGRSPANSR